MPYTRLSDNVQKAIEIAQTEALRLGEHAIGSHHLLLGLYHVTNGIAAKILENFGLNTGVIRRGIEELRRNHMLENTSQAGVTVFSPTLSRVMLQSLEEARHYNTLHIEVEHILLAFTKQEDCSAYHILLNNALSYERVHSLVSESIDATMIKQQSETDSLTVLDGIGIDLSEKAKNGGFDPVIGRAKEIERIINILLRRRKNNPILVGDPGVGKTAIVEGLAQYIAKERAPIGLKHKRIVSLDLGRLLAGTRYRGQFEEKLHNVIDAIKREGDIILFIDEIHSLVGAGASEGGVDASNIFKPALSSGELSVIGATTYTEFRRYFEHDSALERRFQPVKISEPTLSQTLDILKGVRKKYETYHGVTITDEALEVAARLSHQYLPDRRLPDKAIDLMDESCAQKRVEIDRLEMHMAGEKNIQKRDIITVLSNWTNIPAGHLAQAESKSLADLENSLRGHIIGQDKAIGVIADAIRRSRSVLKDQSRPIGTFFFLGPTGVGKTELALALSRSLFGEQNGLIRLDMSEYSEGFMNSRIVGSPPGYIGYEDGGQLTEMVRRNPYSVVLLDEIEKANQGIFNLLLQVLEDGRLTDGKGRTVDFSNTVVIMTSNLGTERIKKSYKKLGFHSTTTEKDTGAADYQHFLSVELERQLPPEFLNRVDEVVIFNPLSGADVEGIASKMLNESIAKLTTCGLSINVTRAVHKFIATEGYDPIYGARSLRRAIRHYIEDPIAKLWVQGEKQELSGFDISIRHGKVIVRLVS